jgi:hypothetical protein
VELWTELALEAAEAVDLMLVLAVSSLALEVEVEVELVTERRDGVSLGPS